MPTPPPGPTLFLCAQATLTADLATLIAEQAAQTPPKKPSWSDIWAKMMQKARTITLNIWQCVVNRRWTSSDEIGSESAADLVSLLLADLTACENTNPIWATEEQ